jgi:CheY-like chemotaxis protein
MSEQPSAATEFGLVKRVLVVDDYQEVRQLLKMMLESEGYQVATVADGETAIEFLMRAQDTWIVLLDIMMPCLSGLEVCARLRDAGPTVARHRVALMTASGLELKECPAPVRTLLRKPFDVGTVQEVIAMLEHDQTECGAR